MEIRMVLNSVKMCSRGFNYSLIILVVVTVTKALPAATSKSKGCDSVCQKECIDVLNKYRTNHGAPNLLFSQHLADKAQHWADSGKFGYDMEARGKYGQLIEWDVKDELPSFTAVIKHWHDKGKDYDFTKGKSKNGQTLHDFTQVVWKKAHKAGCGKGRVFGSRYYVVWMDADGVISPTLTRGGKENVGAPRERDLHWFEVTGMTAVGKPLLTNSTNATQPNYSPQKIRTKSSVSPDEEEEEQANSEENEEKILNDSSNIKGYLRSDLSKVYAEENREVANIRDELETFNNAPYNSYNGDLRETTEQNNMQQQEESQRNIRKMYMDEREGFGSNEIGVKNNKESVDNEEVEEENQKQVLKPLYAIDEGSTTTAVGNPDDAKINHTLVNITPESAFSKFGKKKPFAREGHNKKHLMKKHETLSKIATDSEDHLHELTGVIMGKVLEKAQHDNNDAYGYDSKDHNINLISDDNLKPDMKVELSNVARLIGEKIKSLVNNESTTSLRSPSNESNFTEKGPSIGTQGDDPNARPAKIWMVGAPLSSQNQRKKKEKDDVEDIKNKVTELWNMHVKNKKAKRKKPTSEQFESEIYQDSGDDQDDESHTKKGNEEDTVTVQDLNQLHGYQYDGNGQNQFNGMNPMTGEPIQRPSHGFNGMHMARNSYQGMGGEWFGGYGGPEGGPHDQAMNTGQPGLYDYRKKFTSEEPDPQTVRMQHLAMVLNKPNSPFLKQNKNNVLNKNAQPALEPIKSLEMSKKGSHMKQRGTSISKDYNDVLRLPKELKFHKTTKPELYSAHDMPDMMDDDSTLHDMEDSEDESESQPGFFNEDFTSNNPYFKDQNTQNIATAPTNSQTQQSSSSQTVAPSDQTYKVPSQQASTQDRMPQQLSDQLVQQSYRHRPSSVVRLQPFDQPQPAPQVITSEQNHDNNIQPATQQGSNSSSNEGQKAGNSNKDSDASNEGTGVVTIPYMDQQPQKSQHDPPSSNVMMTVDGHPVKGSYNTKGVYVSKGPFVYQTDTTIVMGGPTNVPIQQSNTPDAVPIATNGNIEQGSNQGNNQQDKKQDKESSKISNGIIPTIFNKPSLLTLLNQKNLKNKTSDSNSTKQETGSASDNKETSKESANNTTKTEESSNKTKPNNGNSTTSDTTTAEEKEKGKLTSKENKQQKEPAQTLENILKEKEKSKSEKETLNEKNQEQKQEQSEKTPEKENNKQQKEPAQTLENILKEQEKSKSEKEQSEKTPEKENSQTSGRTDESTSLKQSEKTDEGGKEEQRNESIKEKQSESQTDIEKQNRRIQEEKEIEIEKEREREREKERDKEVDKEKEKSDSNKQERKPEDETSSNSHQNHVAPNEMASTITQSTGMLVSKPLLIKPLQTKPQHLHQDNIAVQTQFKPQIMRTSPITNGRVSSNNQPSTPNKNLNNLVDTNAVHVIKTSKPMVHFDTLVSRLNHALGLDVPGSKLKVSSIALSSTQKATPQTNNPLGNEGAGYVVDVPEYIPNIGTPQQNKIPKLGQFLLVNKTPLDKLRQSSVLVDVTGTPGAATQQVSTAKHSGCMDASVRCSLWRDRGYCTNLLFTDFMRRHCKNTCGYCAFPKVELQSEKSVGVGHTSLKHDCNDIPTYQFSCPVWKAQGYCQRKEKEMNLACRSTCNFCRHKITKKLKDHNQHGTPSKPPLPTASNYSDGNFAHAQTGDNSGKNVATAQTGNVSHPESTAYAQGGNTFVQTQSSSTQQSAYAVAYPAPSTKQQTYSNAQSSSKLGQQSNAVAQSDDQNKANTKGPKISASAQIGSAEQTHAKAFKQRQAAHAETDNIGDDEMALEEKVMKDSPEYQTRNSPEQYFVTTPESEEAERPYQDQTIRFPKEPGMSFTSPERSEEESGKVQQEFTQDGNENEFIANESREQDEERLNSLVDRLDTNEDNFAKTFAKKGFVQYISTKGCNKSCQTECLETINSYRRNHGAKALQLNQNLANHAQEWADVKAYGRSSWAKQGLGGELIAVGSFYTTFTAAVKAWHDEEKNFDWSTSKTKNGGEIKHFKQLVLKEASLLGCGKTSINGEPYYIAQMDVGFDDDQFVKHDDTGRPKTPDLGWYSTSSPYWKDLQERGQIPKNVHQHLV